MPFPGSVGRQLAWNGGARSRSPHRHSTSSCSAAGSSSWSFAAQVTDTGRKWLPLPKGKGYFMKDDAYHSTEKGDSSCDDGSYYDSKQRKGKGDSSYGSQQRLWPAASSAGPAAKEFLLFVVLRVGFPKVLR